MTRRHDLDGLLPLDQDGAGCAASFELLHEYVEAELAGRDAESELPTVGAHLRSCPACHEDHLGLLEAVRQFGNG